MNLAAESQVDSSDLYKMCTKKNKYSGFRMLEQKVASGEA